MSYGNEYGTPYQHGHSPYEQQYPPAQQPYAQQPYPPAPYGYGQPAIPYPNQQQFYVPDTPKPERLSTYNWIPIVGLVLAVLGMFVSGIDTAQLFANVGTEAESSSFITPLGFFGMVLTWASIGCAIAAIVMWSKHKVNQKALIIINGVASALALATPFIVMIVSTVFFAADLFNVLSGNR